MRRTGKNKAPIVAGSVPSLPFCIAGLDLSLNATGFSHLTLHSDKQESAHAYTTFCPKSRNVIERLKQHREFFRAALGLYPPGHFDWIIVEDYAYSPNSRAITGLSELRGVLYSHLMDIEAEDKLILVSPGTLRKFICAKGNANKDTVLLKAYMKWNREFDTTHECEAYGLAKMGIYAINWFLVGEEPLKYEVEAIKAVAKFKELLKTER